MTRVNFTVDPGELCDQHLAGEYKEITRPFSTKPAAPGSRFKLNEGHVKWCSSHPRLCAHRFKQLVAERLNRGFKCNYTTPPAHKYLPADHVDEVIAEPERNAAIFLVRQRIVHRIANMATQPCWTLREVPTWVNEGLQELIDEGFTVRWRPADLLTKSTKAQEGDEAPPARPPLSTCTGWHISRYYADCWICNGKGEDPVKVSPTVCEDDATAFLAAEANCLQHRWYAPDAWMLCEAPKEAV